MLFLEPQRVHFLQGFIQLISSISKCVDPLDKVLRAQSKVLQLHLALQNGLDNPSTFSGGDSRLAYSWMMQSTFPLCSKAIEAGRFTDINGQRFGRYTVPFERRSLGDLKSLELCPVTLQESIMKSVELRTTIIGKKCLTAAIDTSYANPDSKQDWRHYDWANTKYSVYQLPTEIEVKLLRLMSDLGLSFGCVDLILEPGGRIVFLELNPIGQFLWVEDLTDLPISPTLARFLLDEL